MIDRPCGRAEMCEPCLDLSSVARSTVCMAVAAVICLPHPENCTYEDLQRITGRDMSARNPHVTYAMREAAADSAEQLARFS